MIPVTSSRLTEIGWVASGQENNLGNVYVTFTDGTSGYYQGVPEDIWIQFRDSPSKGKYLSAYIIKQGYPFIRTNDKPGSVQSDSLATNYL